MDPVGSIVRSLCGRDKKRIYLIVGVSSDCDRVLIADGTLRTLDSPKKKNLRHVAVLATADKGKTSIFESDKELREYLSGFEKSIM